MKKPGYTMKQAYAEAGKKMGIEGSPQEEKTESKAEAKAEGDKPAFLLKKKKPGVK